MDLENLSRQTQIESDRAYRKGSKRTPVDEYQYQGRDILTGKAIVLAPSGELLLADKATNAGLFIGQSVASNQDVSNLAINARNAPRRRSPILEDERQTRKGGGVRRIKFLIAGSIEYVVGGVDYFLAIAGDREQPLLLTDTRVVNGAITALDATEDGWRVVYTVIEEGQTDMIFVTPEKSVRMVVPEANLATSRASLRTIELRSGDWVVVSYTDRTTLGQGSNNLFLSRSYVGGALVAEVNTSVLFTEPTTAIAAVNLNDSRFDRLRTWFATTENKTAYSVEQYKKTPSGAPIHNGENLRFGVRASSYLFKRLAPDLPMPIVSATVPDGYAIINQSDILNQEIPSDYRHMGRAAATPAESPPRLEVLFLNNWFFGLNPRRQPALEPNFDIRFIDHTLDLEEPIPGDPTGKYVIVLTARAINADTGNPTDITGSGAGLFDATASFRRRLDSDLSLLETLRPYVRVDTWKAVGSLITCRLELFSENKVPGASGLLGGVFFDEFITYRIADISDVAFRTSNEVDPLDPTDGVWAIHQTYLNIIEDKYPPEFSAFNFDSAFSIDTVAFEVILFVRAAFQDIDYDRLDESNQPAPRTDFIPAPAIANGRTFWDGAQRTAWLQWRVNSGLSRVIGSQAISGILSYDATATGTVFTRGYEPFEVDGDRDGAIADFTAANYRVVPVYAYQQFGKTKFTRTSGPVGYAYERPGVPDPVFPLNSGQTVYAYDVPEGGSALFAFVGGDSLGDRYQEVEPTTAPPRTDFISIYRSPYPYRTIYNPIDTGIARFDLAPEEPLPQERAVIYECQFTPTDYTYTIDISAPIIGLDPKGWDLIGDLAQGRAVSRITYDAIDAAVNFETE